MKKVALALCGALLFGGVFAGCNFDPWKSVTIGDFIYSTNQKSDSGDGCDYAIIGLSEEVKKKDTLVFPSFIEYDEKGNPIYFDTKLYAKWI